MLGEGDAVHPRAVRRLSAITMDEAKLKGCRRGATSNQARLEHLIWSSVWACAYFREIQARVALRRGRPRRFGEVRGGAAASGGGEVARTRAGSVIPANLMSAGSAPVASV